MTSNAGNRVPGRVLLLAARVLVPAPERDEWYAGFAGMPPTWAPSTTSAVVVVPPVLLALAVAARRAARRPPTRVLLGPDCGQVRGASIPPPS